MASDPQDQEMAYEAVGAEVQDVEAEEMYEPVENLEGMINIVSEVSNERASTNHATAPWSDPVGGFIRVCG